MDMKSLGGYVFFFGIGSFVLNYLGWEFIVLAWVDHWGTAVGEAIRIGMTVIGGALWLLAPKPAPEATEEA